MTRLWKASVAFGLCGCLKGPAFFTHGAGSVRDARSTKASSVVVPTTQANGATTGSIAAGSTATQQLTAGDTSPIAGSTAAFPPGSIAIDTQVSIQAGDNLATNAVAKQLGINTTISSSAQPVTISSSIPTDAATPFTLAIPAPTGSSLALDGVATNLAVIYHVRKAGAGNADFTGLITRDKLTLDGGLVHFAASFFGTYQAVLTAQPVTQAAEVAQVPDTPLFGGGRVFFVRGPATATFGGQTGAQGQMLNGLTGWVHARSPGKVGGPTVLQSSYVSKMK